MFFLRSVFVAFFVYEKTTTIKSRKQSDCANFVCSYVRIVKGEKERQPLINTLDSS